MPVGMVIDVAGATAPLGTLLLYGQAVSRTTYADLFTYLGTTYGVGDGSTTFNLPDARGRVIAGKDDMGGSSANRLTGLAGGVNGDNLGATGGAEVHTLTIPEMPGHSHALDMKTGSGGWTTVAAADGAATYTGASSSTGGGGAHNNVQPTIIFNKAIAY
jgi:microcystin-dependent protein